MRGGTGFTSGLIEGSEARRYCLRGRWRVSADETQVRGREVREIGKAKASSVVATPNHFANVAPY
jgi:hypothetical protein